MTSEYFAALRGVIPPIVTVLNASGDLDVASQEAVCARQLEAGVHGVFVAGTTGEGAFLTPAVLGEVVDVVTHFVSGQVPVLVGALAPGTPGVLATVRQVEKAGADGVVVTVPFYAAVSDSELVGHFRTIAASTSLPVLGYSIPSMTHRLMPLGVVERLFSEDLVVGLKDSGDDWESLASAIELGRAYGKGVYSGYEPFVARAVRHGAAGVVVSSCNVDPHGTVRLWDLASAGSPRAAQEQERLSALLGGFAPQAVDDVGATSALIGGIKAALQALGVIASRAVLPPLTPVPERLMGAVREHLESVGVRA